MLIFLLASACTEHILRGKRKGTKDRKHQTPKKNQHTISHEEKDSGSPCVAVPAERHIFPRCSLYVHAPNIPF